MHPCRFCQNWDISKARTDKGPFRPGEEVQVVNRDGVMLVVGPAEQENEGD